MTIHLTQQVCKLQLQMPDNYVHMQLETEVYYELSEDKVCQFYAELLLRPAGKVSHSLSCGNSCTQLHILLPTCTFFNQFNYHEFMESWQQSVPDGMTTSLGQLKVSNSEMFIYHIAGIFHGRKISPKPVTFVTIA